MNAQLSLKSLRGWLLSLVTSLAFLAGCSNEGEKAPPSVTDPALVDALEAKYYTYLDLYTSQQDQNGFIDFKACDALLFTGLLGSVLPEGIDIKAAEKTPGEWTRRPLVNGVDTCYPENSASTISRDMLLGLQWYTWKNQRLDIAEDLYSYGEDNNWIMGKGDASRIFFTPGSQATLAEQIFRLGGENKFIKRSIPQIITESNTGFRQHLDILGIHLRADMTGKAENFNVVISAANRQPRNGYYQYVRARYSDGVYDSAIAPLLNSQLFPEDRLPTSADRKAAWLWQRDDDSDWQPSADGKTHSGGDFLFLAHQILKDLGRLD